MNKRINILLAEDDDDDYQFFKEAFGKIDTDYQVMRAKNGLECITCLKTKTKPDVIFLDLNMPIKDGLECLMFIKEEGSALAEIPVIIYSTSHYIKHIDSAFKNGALFYIVKPNNAEALVEILIKVCSDLAKGTLTTSKQNFVVRSSARVDF